MKFKRILSGVTAFAVALSIAGTVPRFSVKAAAEDGFELFKSGTAAKIYVDTDSAGKTELKQVVRAAGDLQTDIQKVTGVKPDTVSDKNQTGDTAVIVGTIGHSDLIDELVLDEKIDVSAIEGEWEAFKIQLVKAPFEGCENALVIAGSDKRGTIYGIYELSEAIGVSPWYWWGDVPVEQKSEVVLTASEIEKTEMPDVKFRGMFINDEKNFKNWSAQFENAGTSPGTPNKGAYEKVFELMLRLKANTLWPAMHNYSTGFNSKVNPLTGKPFNAEAADNYGIIMGASHCELLLRNNEAEWAPWCEENKGKYNLVKVDNNWNSSYDYTVNEEAMNAYWEERVAVNYQYDNLYTIGLRGLHDSGIACRNLANPTYENKAKVVKKAVEAQIAILDKYEQKYYEETGEHKEFYKVYCPYKEAAEYFKYDLSLPDDTYILWADDNYGYLRAVADSEQLSKYAGGGVYYHISYWGVPMSTLWVASTPLTLMYEELQKTYNSGAGDVFILNVGDIKPGEIPIDFFMNMSWDMDKYDESGIDDFIISFAEQNFNFNERQAAELADILDIYYQTSFAKRPEFQMYGLGRELSMIYNGDEAQRYVNAMADICARSENLMAQLDEDMQNAYYEMVHYMLRASRFSFEKSYYSQKNQLYYTQGRFASTNAYAKAAEDAYQTILSDVSYYNKQIAGGKWDKILNPYVGGIPEPSGAPKVTYVSEICAEDGVGSVCEGQLTGAEDTELEFNSLSDDQRFIDIFNKGNRTMNYKIVTDEAVEIVTSGDTVLSHTSENGKNVYTGTVDVEDRVWAQVNWEKAETGTGNSEITVSDDFGNSKTYTAKIYKSSVDPLSEQKEGYYETNGVVAIEAEHFSANVQTNGQYWKRMPGLGVSGDSMKVYPDLSAETNNTRIDADFETASPYLEYNVYFETTGEYIPTLYRLPTLNAGATCRTAVQLDGGEIKLFKGNSDANDSSTGPWAENVVDGIEDLSLPDDPFVIDKAGWHTIRIYKSDAGIVVDRLVLTEKSKADIVTHHGMNESFNTVSEYTRPSLEKAPVFSLDDLEYAEASSTLLYDFTADAFNTETNYAGVDNKTRKSGLKRYEWESVENLKAINRTEEKVSVRDNSFVYSEKDAKITFRLAEKGDYIVSLAIGDRRSGGISASNMSVVLNSEKVLENFDLPAGQTVEKGFKVTVGDDLTAELELSGRWILAAVEIMPYNEPKTNGGNAEFIPDNSGNINIEAEAALENSEYAKMIAGTDSAKSEWSKTSGISGFGMFSGPNKNGNYSSTNLASNKGAKLEYKVGFKNAGLYYVWALVKSQCNDDDSLLVSLDSSPAVALNDFTTTSGGFEWYRVGSLRVSEAGVHTVTVCEREDGIVLDKIVLKRYSTAPAGTGGIMTRDTIKPTPEPQPEPQPDPNPQPKPQPQPAPAVPKNGVKNGVLYKNSKKVTGTKVVKVGKKTYYVKRGKIQKGRKIVKYKNKLYAVNNGIVMTAKKTRVVKAGKKSYIVSRKGIVSHPKKGCKQYKVGNKRYIVNKNGVIQKNKKRIRIGKRIYRTNKKGIVVKTVRK